MNNRAWAEIGKYAVRNPRRRHSRKSWRKRTQSNVLAHVLDRQRQKQEVDLNFNVVRYLLDKGLSLADAKRKSRRIKE